MKLKRNLRKQRRIFLSQSGKDFLKYHTKSRRHKKWMDSTTLKGLFFYLSGKKKNQKQKQNQRKTTNWGKVLPTHITD